MVWVPFGLEIYIYIRSHTCLQMLGMSLEGNIRNWLSLGTGTGRQKEKGGKDIYLPPYTVFNLLNFVLCPFITLSKVTFKKHKF